MKKIGLIFCAAVVLMSCGSANDGKAETDTTSMPVDTNVASGHTSTTNVAGGEHYPDSSNRDSSVQSTNATRDSGTLRQ